MGRVVREREFDGGMHEDAALEIVGSDQGIDNIEESHELIDARVCSVLTNHVGKSLLDPTILIVERGQHEIFLALEMLVKGGFADADVGEDLIDADVTETIAVKALFGGVDDFLARVSEGIGKTPLA
jgi:hypothetical protein